MHEKIPVETRSRTVSFSLSHEEHELIERYANVSQNKKLQRYIGRRINSAIYSGWENIYERFDVPEIVEIRGSDVRKSITLDPAQVFFLRALYSDPSGQLGRLLGSYIRIDIIPRAYCWSKGLCAPEDPHPIRMPDGWSTTPKVEFARRQFLRDALSVDMEPAIDCSQPDTSEYPVLAWEHELGLKCWEARPGEFHLVGLNYIAPFDTCESAVRYASKEFLPSE